MIPLFYDLLHDKETFVIFVFMAIGIGLPLIGIWQVNK